MYNKLETFVILLLLSFDLLHIVSGQSDTPIRPQLNLDSPSRHQIDDPDVSSYIESDYYDASDYLPSPTEVLVADQQQTASNRSHLNQEAPSQDLYSRISKFGLPSDKNLKICGNFILSYDCRLKHSIWSMQHLTPAQYIIPSSSVKKPIRYSVNQTIHQLFRSSNADYTNSGYDRGHMSPAGDNQLKQTWMDESFCLSNIVPQSHSMNRGVWELLEKYVRCLARSSKNMYVVTGTAYLPKVIGGAQRVSYEMIGRNAVSVPTHLYKVWVLEDLFDTVSMEAFVVPNEQGADGQAQLAQYRIDIDEHLPWLEKFTGLVFFDKVNREDVLKPTEIFLECFHNTKHPSMECTFPRCPHHKVEDTFPNLLEQLSNPTSLPERSTIIQKDDVAQMKQEQQLILAELRSQNDKIAQLLLGQKSMEDTLNGVGRMLRSHEEDLTQIKRGQDSLKSIESDIETLKRYQQEDRSPIQQSQESQPLTIGVSKSAMGQTIAFKQSVPGQQTQKAGSLTKDTVIKSIDRQIESRIDLTIHPEIDPRADMERARELLTEFLKFGLPSEDNLKLSEDYILSYDRLLKHPIWMMEHFTKQQLPIRSADRQERLFDPDKVTDEYFPSSDKGPMSSAGGTIEGVFSHGQHLCMSNIAPQVYCINQGIWRELELYVSNLAHHSKNLYVVTGALYLPEGATGNMSYYTVKDKVGIPTHFYKILLKEEKGGHLSMEAFQIPNADKFWKEKKLKKFRVDMNIGLMTIELATGFRFFDKLDRTKSTSKNSHVLKWNNAENSGISRIRVWMNQHLHGSPMTADLAKAPKSRSHRGVIRSAPKLSLELSPEVDPEASIDAVRKHLSEASRFGLPSRDNLKLSENYILSYDRRLKHPMWLLQHSTGKQKRVANEVKRLFEPNRRFGFDYFQSGGIADSQLKLAKTNKIEKIFAHGREYCTSDIAPQLSFVHTGPMLLLENYISNLACHSKNLYIITGALYGPSEDGKVHYQLIGTNQVGVPTHFYKVIVSENRKGDLVMEAFQVPNSDSGAQLASLAQLRIDIEKDLPRIEQICGLRFFDGLNKKIVTRKVSS